MLGGHLTKPSFDLYLLSNIILWLNRLERIYQILSLIASNIPRETCSILKFDMGYLLPTNLF